MQSRCQKATDSNNPKIHAADLRESVCVGEGGGGGSDSPMRQHYVELISLK